MGRRDEAFDQYGQSLTIRWEIGDRVGEADVLGNLGLTSMQGAGYREAYDQYEYALRIAREMAVPVIAATGSTRSTRLPALLALTAQS